MQTGALRPCVLFLALCFAAEFGHSFQPAPASSSISSSSSKTRWCSNVRRTRLDASENTETGEGETWGGASPFIKARTTNAQPPLGVSRTALRAVENNSGIKSSGVGLFGRFGNINLGAGSNKHHAKGSVGGQKGVDLKTKTKNREAALTAEDEVRMDES